MHCLTVRLAILITALGLVGCSLYSRDRAPYEPKIHDVTEGDFIDLENSAGGIYIEKISSSGIYVSRRNEFNGWILSEDYNSLGNGEFLKIISVDPVSKKARIEQTEIDRRGLFGGLAF